MNLENAERALLRPWARRRKANVLLAKLKPSSSIVRPFVDSGRLGGSLVCKTTS